MNLKIKDTFEGLKDFKPLNNKETKIYSCGPTVYNFVSIGNLRSFITSDIIKKSLRYLGFKISDVMNITDVGHLLEDSDNLEDKIEKEASKQKRNIYEIIDFYTKYFFSAIEKENIKKSGVLAKASDMIPEQIEMIEILEKKDFVYQTKTGVYFDISKFKDYEKYEKQNLLSLEEGARENVVKDRTKKHPYDFRLWQTAYPEHIMQWESPWGKGFPGWHIECSSIIYKYLGKTIDIHTGGTDLIYPHHVNEIAQSRSAFSTNFVNYWIHNEMMLVDGVKMSKSTGNIYTIEDIEKKNINPLALRYLYLNAHYSSLINFTFESLKSSESALNKIYNFLRLNGEYFTKENSKSEKYKDLFIQKISNDFDTPGMLDILHSLIKDKNIDINTKIATILDFDNVLSLDFHKYLNPKPISKDLQALIDTRSIARNRKEWDKADKIRTIIENKGYSIIDLEDKSFVIKKL